MTGVVPGGVSGAARAGAVGGVRSGGGEASGDEASGDEAVGDAAVRRAAIVATLRATAGAAGGVAGDVADDAGPDAVATWVASTAANPARADGVGAAAAGAAGVCTAGVCAAGATGDELSVCGMLVPESGRCGGAKGKRRASFVGPRMAGNMQGRGDGAAGIARQNLPAGTRWRRTHAISDVIIRGFCVEPGGTLRAAYADRLGEVVSGRGCVDGFRAGSLVRRAGACRSSVR